MKKRIDEIGDPTAPSSGQIEMSFETSLEGESLDTEERAALEDENVRFYIAQMRATIIKAGATPHDLRQPCTRCAYTLGIRTVRSNQNTVSCARCNTFLYNAPKTETGQRARTVTTMRVNIKPGQQARILDRDHGRCLLCGTPENLTIGHLLSVADGALVGAVESELSDDANLAAMCEGCNAGLGRRSVSARTYVVLLGRILQAEIRRVGPRR